MANPPSLFNPLSYPFSRLLTYADGSSSPPVVSADGFYNPTNQAVQALASSQLGYLYTLLTEEFFQEVLDPITQGPIGETLSITQSKNVQFRSLSSFSFGEHGVGRFETMTSGAGNVEVAEGNGMLPPKAKFLLTARVRLGNPKHLDSFAKDGLRIGLGIDFKVRDNPCFLAGKDTPNWKVRVDASVHDTGIPLLENTWYGLALALDPLNLAALSFYIKPEQTEWTLVKSLAWPWPMDPIFLYRSVLLHFDASANAQEFVDLDHLSLLVSRFEDT